MERAEYRKELICREVLQHSVLGTAGFGSAARIESNKSQLDVKLS